MFDTVLSIGREDDNSAMTFNTLEKMGGLRIRESVMGIVDCTSRPEQRVYFIEEEDRATGFCFVKYVIQILLRLTDVLTHHRRHIHLEQLYVQGFGQRLGRLPSAERRGA